MEQRKPERAPPSARTASATAKRLLLAGAVLTVLVLLFLAFSRLRSVDPVEPAQTFDDLPRQAQAPGDADLPAAPAGAGVDAAVIVDDPQTDDPFRRLGIGGDATATPAAPATAPAAPPAPPDGAVASARPAAAPAPRRQQPSADGTAGEGEGRLFSTLMRIIHQDGAGAADERHESMDALVARLRADEDEAARTRERLENLGGPRGDARPAVRASRVERALAACPKANTPAGIACRDRICAPHAGKHAACPL